MTNTHQALERLTAANPVPDSAPSFPAAGLSPAALLERIEERNTLMTQTPTRIRPTVPVQPPKRSRGPLIALATAAAVILIGVVFAVVSPGGDPVDPATTLAPDTTVAPTTTAAPTTVAPTTVAPTTVAPTTAAPSTTVAAPLLSPIEVANALFARFNDGDIEGYEALIDPEADYSCGNGCVDPDVVKFFSRTDFANFVITQGNSRHVSATGADSVATCQATGDDVRCQWTITSGLQPGVVIVDQFVDLTIRNGVITWIYLEDFNHPLASEVENLAVNDYRVWLRAADRDTYDELFAFETTMLTLTPEQRAQHRELIAQYLQETAG